MSEDNLKQSLRRSLRLQRSRLSTEEKMQKAKNLKNIVVALPEFLVSKHIAAYWPSDGEMSPIPILLKAYSMGKKCYLPVLNPLGNDQLIFVAYKPGDPLKTNRFGILEPEFPRSNSVKNTIPAWALNVVLMPVVSFDNKGNRLGMGMGYYDRTFSFLKNNFRPRNPQLIGLAYEFQRQDTLPNEVWDVPLTGIATECCYTKTKR